MTHESLLLAGVNYADGMKRFGGNSAIYEKYLVRFPQDPNYHELMLALSQKDYDAAFKHAHALKGLVGNLSLERLYKQIVPLVEALRAGQVTGLDPLAAAVSESYRLIVDAIAADQPSDPA